MKKFNFTPFTLLFTILSVISLPLLVASCLDDDEPTRFTIGTLKVIEGNDYYFLLDNNKTMFPGDTTWIRNYTVTDGQRAVIAFSLLDEEASGFDYNIKVERIEDILTKNIIPLTTETADSIGDDKMEVESA